MADSRMVATPPPPEFESSCVRVRVSGYQAGFGRAQFLTMRGGAYKMHLNIVNHDVGISFIL